MSSLALSEAGQSIIVALDGLPLLRAFAIVEKLGHSPYAYKVDHLWDELGIQTWRTFEKNGAHRLFVDLKLKDIPTVVALRALVVRDSGAHILTVDASGDIEMMRAAKKNGPPLIYAVTVLTSLDDAACARIHGRGAVPAVLELALMAQEAGMHGIICSPHEVGLLAKQPELEGVIEFIVPGIRPAGKETHDHKRFDTPAAVIRAGATRLVIGRPITQAPDPVAAFDAIAAEIAAAMQERK